MRRCACELCACISDITYFEAVICLSHCNRLVFVSMTVFEQVMHVLIARSPPELELPHARSSMSLAEYCEWVDGMVIASETGTAATLLLGQTFSVVVHKPGV